MAQSFDFPGLKYKTDKFLEDVPDGTLVVLKGHLLLEDILYQKVCARCPSPSFVEKAQLRFPQLLNVVRALYMLPESGDNRQKRMEMLWDAAEALNTLRNRLAHKLEPNDISHLLRRLDIQLGKALPSLSDPRLANALGNSIAMLLGFAAALGTVDEHPTN